jgi:hypothetical protein
MKVNNLSQNQLETNLSMFLNIWVNSNYFRVRITLEEPGRFLFSKEKHRSNKCIITDPLKPACLGAKRESERDSEVVRELAGGGEDSAALQPGLQPALWRGLSLVLFII